MPCRTRCRRRSAVAGLERYRFAEAAPHRDVVFAATLTRLPYGEIMLMVTYRNNVPVGKMLDLDRLGFGCGALSTLGVRPPRGISWRVCSSWDLPFRHGSTLWTGLLGAIAGRIPARQARACERGHEVRASGGVCAPLPLGLAMRLNAAKRRWLAGLGHRPGGPWFPDSGRCREPACPTSSGPLCRLPSMPADDRSTPTISTSTFYMRTCPPH